MKLFRSIAAAFLGLALFGAQDSRASLGDKAMASHVRSLVLELSVDEAEAKLALADPQDAMVAVERARLELYKGDCTSALSTLAKHDLLEDESGRQIGGAARGCISATAGSVVYTDEASGSWVRLSDAEDAVLLPSIYDVVSRTRALFQRELNVVMPKWVRIELVRDQFSLSKMTGLPLTAARTTGTIGIAKWGRVIMVSPRAADGGYGFLDTMAHELTHLALARASTDQAPLWLQEGVARRLESAWREPSPFDDTPRAVDVAALGLSGGIGPDIDAIGPSIALLPSALEAQITYAKVQSFMTFYTAKRLEPPGCRSCCKSARAAAQSRIWSSELARESSRSGRTNGRLMCLKKVARSISHSGLALPLQRRCPRLANTTAWASCYWREGMPQLLNESFSWRRTFCHAKRRSAVCSPARPDVTDVRRLPARS